MLGLNQNAQMHCGFDDEKLVIFYEADIMYSEILPVADPGFGRRGGPKRLSFFTETLLLGMWWVHSGGGGGSQVRKGGNMLHCLSGAPPSVGA